MGKAAKKTEQVDNETKEEEKFKVQVGPIDGVNIKGHPLKDGTIIELTQADIDTHREHGIPLLDVAEDNNDEVYNVHEEWVNPDNEAA